MRKKEVYVTLLLLGIIFIAGCSEWSEKGEEQTIYRGNIPVGSFKAVIGDEIVITNGPDIISVDSSEDDAVEEFCIFSNNTVEYICPFSVGVQISNEAAKRQAEITGSLEIIGEGSIEYLSEPLVIYLNGEKWGEIRISSDLKGYETQDIQI